MSRPYAVLATLAALTWPAALSAEPTRPAAPLEAFELVFIRDTGPVLLRIHVLLGVQTVQAQFNGYLKKWFQFLDRNGDGKLDAVELIGAPKATTMAQIMRNGAFFQGEPNTFLTLAALRKSPGESATLDDFVDYYRRNNLQALQIAPTLRGRQYQDQPGEVLFKILDVNNDGKLSREEVNAAPARLRKYDLNDDELIAAAELVPEDTDGMARPPSGRSFPAPAAANSFGLSFYPLINQGERERFPQILLSHFDKDENGTLSRKECGFDAETFARLDKNKDGELDEEELAEWLMGRADFEFRVHLPEAGGALTLRLEAAGARFKNAHSTPSAQAALIKLSDVEITLEGSNAGRVDARPFLTQLFTQADKEERGYLEVSDLKEPQFRFLRTLFPVADRNRDGKLTLEELSAYILLQNEAQGCQAALAVIEQGRALFQILDANRDGQLSTHELRNAWSRLEPLDVQKKGYIVADQLARQFRIVVAPQSAQFLLNVSPRTPYPVRGSLPLARAVPEWFRKMDANGDGFVSPREFLGSRADFARIDTNGDGLIDPEEAERFDAQAREKNGRPVK